MNSTKFFSIMVTVLVMIGMTAFLAVAADEKVGEPGRGVAVATGRLL